MIIKNYEFKCPECRCILDVDDKDLEYFCYDHLDPIKMVRVFNISGIAFKGSGFYRNDK